MLIVFRSRTMHPQSMPLTIGGTVLKGLYINYWRDCHPLVKLGVTFYSKMTFKKDFRLVSRAASQRLGILRKSC